MSFILTEKIIFRLFKIALFFFLFAVAVTIVSAKERERVMDGLCTFKLVDPIDKSPISDAHVCVELEGGEKMYAVTNIKGEVTLKLNLDDKGVIVISKIGFVTGYYQPHDLFNGKEIHLQPDVFNIDQVVVTGQVRPAPVDSSIYRVKLISEERIKQAGAVNLSELLVAEANIRLSSDLILGTQIEMLGMTGQNVKVMIDGVPVIGRLDGSVDLSQINLANIAQVEIIEGPMSVVYGNNALAGTINLISKQYKYYKTVIQANAYAESVGRYAVNANVSQKLGKHTVTVDGGYEDFSGVDFDNSNRYMDWKPKTTYHAKGGYLWNDNGWNVNAKVGIYSDELLYKSDILNYKVYDVNYYTKRIDASANVSKTWGLNHVNLVTAYNYYDRSDQEYTKDLTTLETIRFDKISSQEASQKMFRGIYGRTMGLFFVQTGVDLNDENMKGPRIMEGSQNIGDYAFFINAKYQPIKLVEIQPGFRAAYNTEYNAPLVYSLNAKWNFLKKWNWRASVAKGFRAPDLKELYYEFVDSNHDIYGNPNLNAESSYNYNTSIEFASQGWTQKWKFNASAYYNDVNNLISLIQDENSTRYTYQNIDQYKSKGVNVDIKYAYKTLFIVRGGYGVTGRYNSYTKQNGSDKYNITHDIFAGFKMTEPSTHISFAIDYKYNGELPFFYTDSETGLVMEGNQDAYHTLNASATYNIYKNRLQLIVGAKNLFDVTTVHKTPGDEGAHSGGSGVPISYGRSYFINLAYKFTKTKN